MEITLEVFLAWVSIASQVGLLIIVLLLIMVLVRVIRLLGLVNEIAESIADMVHMVNAALWKPIEWYSMGMKFVKKLLGGRR